VKTSTSTRWRKIRVPGFVTLFHDGETGFRIRYMEPGTGRNIRRRLPTDTLDGALEIVRGYNTEIGNERKVPGLKVKAERRTTVRESLIEAVKAMGGNADTQNRALQGVNRFLAFLGDKYPAVKSWADIRPSMCQAWVRSMEAEGLAFDTLRLALVPVKYASTYWHEESGCEDIMASKLVRSKIKTIRKNRAKAETATALSAEQLTAFLTWLKKNRPALYPMATLMGLAGLRMFEAAYLRHCDVDNRCGTVTIDETPLHKPKNRPSHRTIPVCKAALEAVADHVSASKVQTIEGELFLHSGKGPWKSSGLFSAWRLAMIEARTACKLPAEFKARNLRATFVTLARRAKADYPMLQQYIGHAPGDVMGEHYDSVTVADLKREVVDVFQCYLDSKMTTKCHSVREESPRASIIAG